jgi:phosphoenolpyruvate synthase/pyruvate phosphate dikinase
LNQKGILEQKNDVFYLTYDELKQLISDNSLTASLNRRIVERKAEIERFKDITLPEVIYNELPESALIKGKVLRDLRGVATSRGHYIGPARLVHGPSDFGKIHTGDVLVIPFSDVSWTPLFSKASAVVSESGGILSHCSIVAREYGIPAVVSVTGAMTLVDGTTLAVDGYSGKVQIMEEK